MKDEEKARAEEAWRREKKSMKRILKLSLLLLLLLFGFDLFKDDEEEKQKETIAANKEKTSENIIPNPDDNQAGSGRITSINPNEYNNVIKKTNTTLESSNNKASDPHEEYNNISISNINKDNKAVINNKSSDLQEEYNNTSTSNVNVNKDITAVITSINSKEQNKNIIHDMAAKDTNIINKENKDSVENINVNVQLSNIEGNPAMKNEITDPDIDWKREYLTNYYNSVREKIKKNQ